MVADAIVLGLAFFGGLRREEITRLRVDTVDVGRRRLVSFVRKGGGEDTLPIGTMLDTFERLFRICLPGGGHSSPSGPTDMPATDF